MSKTTILEMRQNIMRYQQLIKQLESRYGPTAGLPLSLHTTETSELHLTINKDMLLASTPEHGVLCFELCISHQERPDTHINRNKVQFVFDSDPHSFYKQRGALKAYKEQFEEAGNLGGHPSAQVICTTIKAINEDIETALERVKAGTLGLVATLALPFL